jgi:hypothetical protein
MRRGRTRNHDPIRRLQCDRQITLHRLSVLVQRHIKRIKLTVGSKKRWECFGTYPHLPYFPLLEIEADHNA